MPIRERIEFRFVVRSKDDWSVAEELQTELSKKYPVERAMLRIRNPHDPGQFPTNVAIAVYLVEKIAGPTLRAMMEDGYAYLRKRIAKKSGKTTRRKKRVASRKRR